MKTLKKAVHLLLGDFTMMNQYTLKEIFLIKQKHNLLLTFMYLCHKIYSN